MNRLKCFLFGHRWKSTRGMTAEDVEAYGFYSPLMTFVGYDDYCHRCGAWNPRYGPEPNRTKHIEPVY